MYTGFTTVVKYNVLKICSNGHNSFTTRKEHKQTLAQGSEECKEVFLQVWFNSNQFLQSYTSTANEVLRNVLRSCKSTKSRSPKCDCTRPTEQNPNETQKQLFPGHSIRVPAVPKFHRRVFRLRNQLSRNGGALVCLFFRLMAPVPSADLLSLTQQGVVGGALVQLWWALEWSGS